MASMLSWSFAHWSFKSFSHLAGGGDEGRVGPIGDAVVDVEVAPIRDEPRLPIRVGVLIQYDAGEPERVVGRLVGPGPCIGRRPHSGGARPTPPVPHRPVEVLRR